MTTRLSLTFSGLFMAAQLLSQPSTQNNTLRGRVLYQSSGNKPAVGVRIAEPDATAVFSLNNGDYQLKFQNKRNGATLALEVGKDDGKGQKLELVNEKEVKAAKLPSSAEEPIDIIVCPAGQRDIAAQRYYRILRTTADRELERKKKEVEDLLEQKEKDYQQISDLFALIDRMQAALDSAKIREQAFNIASINLDRASQMVKDAVKKIDEENDVEGALKILNAEALDTAYEHASAIKRQGEAIVKKADVEIQQVIEGYEFKISLLEPQFNYGEVAECYEKIVGIYEREGYDKVARAKYLALEALSWFYNGNYQKALESHQSALVILNKSLPIDHPDLAHSYNDMALVYGKLGDFQKELEFNLKALSIFEKILPPEHPDIATSYNNLAGTYGDLGEYQKRLEFNQKALNVREKVLPAEHPDLASSYSHLALTYRYLGKYQKALEFNLKALVIFEKVLPAEHPDLASSYSSLALTYRSLGEYQKALEFNLKDLAIGKKILPAEHPDLALSYSNLALTYRSLGEYQKALEFNLKTLAIQEKILPAEHPELARSYGNLAVIYGKLGDFQKQLEFNLKALSIREKILPDYHPDLALSYNTLAYAYGDLGEHQKALEFYLKSLKIREKVLAADHPDLAISYNNLAHTYGGLGEYQKALEFYLKSLEIGEKVLSPDHPELAIYYHNVGRAYRDINEYEKAVELAQKSIRIGEASTPKHRLLNRFYTHLGVTYVKARQYPEAKAALEKSESLKPEERVYRGWAMYHASQKKKKQAVESLQKAVSLGFKDLKWLETEPDLKNIRKEKGYKELVEQLKKG